LNEVVLDASVIIKWFAAEQRGTAEARELRNDYEAGHLFVMAPELVFLEILNAAGRRWGWGEDALLELAASLDDLSLEVREADHQAVVSWVARGLTAYDAAYVALAEEREVILVTDDEVILRLAPEISRPLVRG